MLNEGRAPAGNRYNIIVMALGFMVLFSAYNTLQNYATSLFPNGLGNQSLAVLYVTCALSVFAAPAVVDAMGVRAAMVVGAATYVVYMISLIRIIPAVVLAMSAVIGFGAAILWVANGVYITMASPPSQYAENTSTFWAIFQICNVAGNLITYLVFPHLSSTSALYAGFAVTGAVGTVLLMFLGPPVGVGGLPPPTPRPRKSCAAQLDALWRGASSAVLLLCDWRLLCIVPLFFFSGYELAYWTGAFPQLLPTSTVGLVLTAAGVGEVAGAYSMGWMSDRVGRSASLVVGCAFFTVGLVISALMKAGVSVGGDVGGAPVGAFVAALGFGLGDSCFNTNAYAMCSQLHGNKGVEGGEGEGPSRKARADVAQHGRSSREDVEQGLLAAEQLSTASGTTKTSDPGAEGSEGVGAGGPATDGSASVGAFTVFQLFQNIGSALGFGLGLVWPLTDQTDAEGNVTPGTLGQVYLTTAVMAFSFLTFAAVDYHERGRRRT